MISRLVVQAALYFFELSEGLALMSGHRCLALILLSGRWSSCWIGVRGCPSPRSAHVLSRDIPSFVVRWQVKWWFVLYQIIGLCNVAAQPFISVLPASHLLRAGRTVSSHVDHTGSTFDRWLQSSHPLGTGFTTCLRSVNRFIALELSHLIIVKCDTDGGDIHSQVARPHEFIKLSSCWWL